MLIKSTLRLYGNPKVILDGEDFCKIKDYSKLSAVFQEPSTQILSLTCKDELKLQSFFHPVDEKIAKEIMGEYYDKGLLHPL